MFVKVHYMHTHTCIHKYGVYMCVCTIHACPSIYSKPYSITDELLPAHDKSPPVCGISVVVHVGARPDPTASAPVTHHLRPCLPDWLTDGRISPDKKHRWLIAETHLTTRGGPGVPGIAGLEREHFYPACPPDFLGQIPLACGTAWSSLLLCAYTKSTFNCFIAVWNIYSTP